MDKQVTNYRANLLNLSILCLMGLFLIIGYIGEIVKKQRPVTSVIIFISLLIVSCGISLYLYCKDKDSSIIKYVVFAGISLVYIYATFTSTRILVFTYVMPVMITSILYFNLKYVKIVCYTMLGINIARVIYMVTVQNQVSNSLTTDYTIQLVTILMISITLIRGSKITIMNNREQMASIEEMAEKEKQIANEIINIAGLLDKNCNHVFNHIHELEQSGITVEDSIGNISVAMEQAVESIETQKVLTSNIHENIKTTVNATEDMNNISDKTIHALDEGISAMEELESKSRTLDKKGDLVYDAIQSLASHMQQIQSITQTISSIANETNILSLNAAIESARAGEVGKGFAVVASEVRNLSEDTKESVNQIANIIFSLQESMTQCTEAIADFRAINSEQAELIHSTYKVFSKTNEVAHRTKESANILRENINSVLKANTEIVESITEISALSQETMASVEETAHTTQTNVKVIEDTKQLTQELLDTSLQMRAYL